MGQDMLTSVALYIWWGVELRGFEKFTLFPAYMHDICSIILSVHQKGKDIRFKTDRAISSQMRQPACIRAPDLEENSGIVAPYSLAGKIDD